VNALGKRIADLIAASGPITVAQFMTLALHDPAHGYYATRDPLGARGDFVTAPEISQMFGELVGLWCAQVWHDQGMPLRPHLVELGPGRGTLMADALRALKLVPNYLASLKVTLVEASPALAAIQREALAKVAAPVAWQTRFDPAHIDGPLFLVANEFLDALPIRQFVHTENGWHERTIVTDALGALAFALAPASANAFVPADRSPAPDGAVYESCPSAAAIVEEIARTIARQGGAALVVDYGYDAPEFGETLQAVSGHKFSDVLSAPGESDLSAHVDFRALAKAAAAGGARAYGPVEQGRFLTALGIAERAERLTRSDSEDAKRARDRLVHPDQMGRLFKALAIVPPTAAPPPGFSQ